MEMMIINNKYYKIIKKKMGENFKTFYKEYITGKNEE